MDKQSERGIFIMAIKFANGTGLESVIGSATMAATNVTMSVAGITNAGATAPNTTNQATGVVIYQNSLPNSVTVYTVELIQGGITRATATMNGTDLQVGYNYVRFPTPHTFLTTAANAYTVKISGTLASGTLAVGVTGFWFQITYDDITSPASGDDIIMCGWQDGGLTPKTWTITGTSTVFGSGAVKGLGASVTRTMQGGLMIGNGGTVKMDNTANCTVEIRGSIFVTRNGFFDKRAHTSDINIVSKLIIDCDTANGNYGFHLPGNFNGNVLTDGMEVSHRTQYASGVGTAADPIVTSTAHNLRVNDEIIIPGLTYDGNQLRYVISIPNSTQLVVSTTIGGAESAVTNTPAAGCWIGNLTRNSIIAAKNNSFGYYLYNNGNSLVASSFSYTRWEYASCASGPNLQFIPSNEQVITNIDGMVGYYNSAAGRTSWSVGGTAEMEINDCILLETLGSNYVGQSGLALAGCSNKTVNRLMHYAAPGSTLNCAGLSITGSSTNNITNDSHFYGATANNGSFAYAIGIIVSHSNTFNDCTINNSRVRGVYTTDGFSNEFNNCDFGTIGSNNTDIFVASSSLAQMVFNSCNFGSTTLISNYQNALEGTRVGFHRYQDTDRRHRSYQTNVEIFSTGSGLTDTLADTTFDADSLAMKNTPLSATNYGRFNFFMPQRAGTIVLFTGKLYKTSDFNGNCVVDLYLDGSSTPDASYTLTGSHSTWIPFVLSADYSSGAVDRNARIQIRTRGTVGSVYLDTLFNSAKLTNPIGSLDLWQDGVPNEYLVSTIASAGEIAEAVENSATIQEILSNTDATEGKVGQL